MKLFFQYILNMLMATDQFWSTVLGGHPDETISQRLGRAYLANVKWVIPFRATVDFFALILVGERDHCVNSLKGRTMAKEIWNWGGKMSDCKVDMSDV